ncbi:MAG: DNA polymerase beta domain-containing protein [Parcubacteria group bacterium Gr01-1014_48]|nr:MAG: DNA polymerase beta domain-containing protein [Parcubacteria group bacterium Greene0416_14]TSC74064.1 MAG: DNA polymerase beta domain-containing protein [Parcubacteria group bacterium Gr01-1014_48]TSD01148.1 MAG: DNA polymerase beta domain-containing protein [Parcubacteria group bacterium Greene1014_15]TSD08224.1 MAG: DNA polymerase beta domain-containing protein [Parcubacteria group bacterium Greene0714_4]
MVGDDAVLMYGILLIHMTQLMEKAIKDIVKKIVAEYQPEKIILFGSYAWGTPHEWSDVDLFIEKKSEKNIFERMRDVDRILFGITTPVDALVYTPQQTEQRLRMGDPFLKKVFSLGKELYAK